MKHICGIGAVGGLLAYAFWRGWHSDTWEEKLRQMLDEYSKQKAAILWISTSMISDLLSRVMPKVTPSMS